MSDALQPSAEPRRRKTKLTPGKPKEARAAKAAPRAKRQKAQYTHPVDRLIEKRPVGHPTTYTLEIAEDICSWLSDGKSLSSYCRQPGKPMAGVIYSWLRKWPEFSEMYTRAREDQADAQVDKIIDIATTCDDANKARVLIDAIKWTATKMKPRVYADRQHIETTVNFAGEFEEFVRGINARLSDKAKAIARQAEVLELEVIDKD